MLLFILLTSSKNYETVGTVNCGKKMANFYKKKQTKKTELITFKKSFQAISTILNLL